MSDMTSFVKQFIIFVMPDEMVSITNMSFFTGKMNNNNKQVEGKFTVFPNILLIFCSG